MSALLDRMNSQRTASVPAAASSAPAPAASAAQEVKASPGSDSGMSVSVPVTRPAPMNVSAMAHKHHVEPLSFSEIVEQNEAWLQSKEALMRAAIEQAGLTPDQVAIIYDLDITGHEVQVCLACGQIGHDYQPSMQRVENPEINMLDESVTLYLELASRVGIRHGLVAYDEQVLPLKPVGGSDGASGKQTILSRFAAFRKRQDPKEIKNGVVEEWMREEAKKWDPSWATRKMVGEPNDELVFDVTDKLFKQAGDVQLKGVLVAKGLPPKVDAKLMEKLGVSKGFKIKGIAVGKKCVEIAKKMFKRTDAVPDMHGLKDSMVNMMLELINEAGNNQGMQKTG